MRASLLAGFMAFGMIGAAQAANYAPPSGQAVFSLDGQFLPHTYTSYTVSFLATAATTNLSFAFRDDPAYFSIDNIRLTTGGGANLVVNGDFAQGPLNSQTPTGFTYLNLYSAAAAGIVSAGCGTSGSNCYFDGAVGAYDSITQAIGTAVGTLYTLTFDLKESSSQLLGSAIQTGTQAGIDLVVYAGTVPTLAVPEPASLALLGAGVLGLAAMRRRRAGGDALA